MRATRSLEGSRGAWTIRAVGATRVARATRSDAHVHLVQCGRRVMERVVDDRDLRVLLRVALADLDDSAARATRVREPARARCLWSYCAAAEVAIEAAAHEARRRRRIAGDTYQQLLDAAEAAREHRRAVVVRLLDPSNPSDSPTQPGDPA